jgi:hypothetical protein
VCGPSAPPGGYRYLTLAMLRDISTFCYRQRWFPFSELESIFLKLAMDAHKTGECEIPG